MSSSQLTCFNCSHEYEPYSETCSNCGLIVVNKALFDINIEKQHINGKLLSRYEELKDKLQKFNEIADDIQQLNNKKNQAMTQMNAIAREIRGLQETKYLFEREITTIQQDQSISGKFKSFIGLSKLKISKLEDEIQLIDDEIQDLRLAKQKKKQNFYDLLSEIEDSQENNFNKTQIENEFQEISTKIANIISELTHDNLEHERKRISSYITKLKEDIKKLEKAYNYLHEAIIAYRDIKASIRELKINFSDNPLKEEFNLQKKKSKIAMKANEVSYFVKVSFLILEDLQRENRFHFLSDFEILVKYLNNYLKEVQFRFANSSRLQSQIDLAYAHTLKVKVWLETILSKANNSLNYLENENEKILQKLNLDPLNKIEYYFRSKNPQTS